MIDLTRKDQARKAIERIVEGYSDDEKLEIRITGATLEITTRNTVGPVVTISWARIHRQAIEAELAATRRKINE